MIRTVLARAATEVAVARHLTITTAERMLRAIGLLPQPVADHQVVILAGRVEHLEHPAGCPGGWCPVVDALSREDRWLPAGVFLAMPLGDGFVALDLATGGGR